MSDEKLAEKIVKLWEDSSKLTDPGRSASEHFRLAQLAIEAGYQKSLEDVKKILIKSCPYDHRYKGNECDCKTTTRILKKLKERDSP